MSLNNTAERKACCGVVALIAAVLLSSCYQFTLSTCLDSALTSARTWHRATGDEVGIATGTTTGKGVTHAQAFSRKDGEFFWLRQLPEVVEVYPGEQHRYFIPEKFRTVEETLNAYK